MEGLRTMEITQEEIRRYRENVAALRLMERVAKRLQAKQEECAESLMNKVEEYKRSK